MRVLSGTVILLVACLFTPQQSPVIFHPQATINQAKGGSISGTIVGPETNSAAGTIVMALRQEPDAPQPRTFTTKTDDKGRFSFTSLPVGSYRIEVSPKDKWLFKQIAQPVTVRQSRNVKVDLRLQFIERCEGKRADDLTSSDRAAIIKLMLEEALMRKQIPSHPRLIFSDKKILVSAKNIESIQVSSPPGFEIVLLSPSEIQAWANREGDLMYLQFEKIEIRGSCVAVSLCNFWADGTSTIETGPKDLLGEGCIYYVLYKRAGTWTGEFVTGWIS